MSSVGHGGAVTSAQDLVSHVRRRVGERDRLIRQLATWPQSPKRKHAAARLVDVLRDLREIRGLVGEDSVTD